MKEKDRRTVTLLLALGFVLSALAVFAPAGAAPGRDPNFIMTVSIKDDAGISIQKAQVGQVVNITANATIPVTQPSVTSLNMTLTIDDQPTGATFGPVALTNASGDYATFTWAWQVPHYGDFRINVTAINGTDTASQTVTAKQYPLFKGMGTNMTLGAVTVDPAVGYMGLTSFTVTAVVNNAGTDIGTANVSLYLDNSSSMLVGYALAASVPADGGSADAVFTGMINATGIADGSNHTITGVLMDITTTYSTSGNVTLTNPKANVVVNTLTAQSSVTIIKGATVNVVVTAKVTNTGQLDAVGTTLSFYDTDTSAAENTSDPFNLSVAASTDIVWTWVVTDTAELGNHTIYAQVDAAAQETWTNVTVNVIGVANMTMTKLEVSPSTGGFEGDSVAIAATLFNNGTDDYVNQTLTWWDATNATPVQINSTSNVTVPRGQTVIKSIMWALPLVDADGNRTVKALIGTSSMTVAVMDRNKAPKIEIVSFTIPTTIKIGDAAQFSATIKNNGTGDAVNMTVSFLDGTTTMNTSAPFSLTVGTSRSVTLNVTLAGAPDTNHTFSVSALGATLKSVIQTVGHKLAPASIIIVSFTVKPSKLEGKPKDSTQDFKLTITLKNSGELMGMVLLNITEGRKLLTVMPVPVILDGGATVVQNYTWKVKGDGSHTAAATLKGDAGTPNTIEVKATLKYASGFIPGFGALAMAAAVAVGAILVRRRKN